jgi:ketosteroid isomerase-like protein
MADADQQTVQEIIKLSSEWMEAVARRDQAALDRILAHDFLIAGWLPEGRLGDKQFYIEDCLRPVDIEQGSYHFDRWKVRTYGDTVVVNCVFEAHAMVGGQPWGGVFLLTSVWVRDGDHWRVVTSHSSPVVAATGQSR